MQTLPDPFVYGAELGRFFEISDMDSMSAYSGRLSGRTFIMTLFFLFHHTIPAGSSPLPLPGYHFRTGRAMEQKGYDIDGDYTRASNR